jgi:hypothetical protein
MLIFGTTNTKRVLRSFRLSSQIRLAIFGQPIDLVRSGHFPDLPT